uniref:3-hydroxyisobutyryl-CoA hydrolase n=1 Tax=Caenorhabditis japonica TaxID=281687 RepID=A0A8R1IRD2_CAEJA
MTSYKSLKFLKVENVGDFVYKVTLNRPEKYNALNLEIWGEIGDCFKLIHDDPDCRVVILQGEGKHFCTGLDMSSGSVLGMGSSDEQDQARKSRATRRNVEWMQRQFTYVDDCSKPVLLAIHGYCMGAGVDLATACDIRYASKDAVFL